ncbi:MAG: DAPG hydrolase family protein [Catenibacillus sp.]
MNYIANAGQTYLPFKDNIHVDILPFKKPAMPNPPLPELVLNPEAEKKGYVLASQKQHFLPGVTSKMLDWFWANMEKGYYLWAPGSHKRFNWVKSPAEYGMEQSVHMISETIGKGCPVFGGNGVQIHRLSLETFFPFTTCLKHVICEGVYNDVGELVDSTIHMWEDRAQGCVHMTATVQNSRVSMPPAFIIDMLKDHPNAKIIPNFATDHEDYEASQWPVFLPTLYRLWENHPDPSQNVHCNLEVEKCGPYAYRYVEANGPVRL